METVEELKEHIRELEKVIEDKDETIDDLKQDITDLEHEECDCDEPDLEDFSEHDIELAFKANNDITSSLTDEMKFDLIMKNYHKVSLEDFERFFKSKGLEIV